MLKSRKGDADIVALVALVGLIITGITIIINTANFDRAAQGQMTNVYDMAEGGEIVTGLKQTFEKTALFFGMMKTANELGAHAGVSQAVVDTADTLTPKMYAEDKIPYLAVALCPDGTRGCETKKRMPFLFYEDKNVLFGTVAPFTIISGNSKYAQNMDEVAGGKYSFYVLVQAIILKPGASILKVCQKERCIEKSLTETGFATIKADDTIVKNSADDITLTVAGFDKDVAVLREVAVSIYDREVVESPNKLLEESMNTYQKKMQLFTKDSLTVKINPFEAAFIPAGKGVYGALDEKQGFTRGIAWAPAGLSAESQDVSVTSAGFAEEEAKIRYWRMYGFADYFVNNLDLNGLVKPRLSNKIIAVNAPDYFSMTYRQCPDPPKDYPVSCPPPQPTPGYSFQAMSDALNSGLDELVLKLNNKHVGEGFSWKISILNGGVTRENVQQKQYARTYKWVGDTCSWYDGAPVANWDMCTTTTTYEYLVKNIKILVEITDEKYKYFDSAINAWANPVFKFYVELDNVDDNYCSGYYCNTQQAGATIPKNPEPIVPEYP